MQVKEIMKKNPACCMQHTSLEEAVGLMVLHHCHSIPVVENMRNLKPVGVITDRDITYRAIAVQKNPLEMTVKECMTTPCVTVAHQASVEECRWVLEENKIRLVAVVDNQGRCCGVVEYADVVRYATRELEAELVTELSGETASASNFSADH